MAASPEVARTIPALARLAASIGDAQVRNRGTLGGSLAHDDPAADYPAAVLALAATVQTDRRRIPADAFFVGLYQTALEPDELVTAVRFPIPEKAAYAKFPHPASRFALVGVMVAKGPAGVRVAVTGAGPGVFRATALEGALSRDFSAAAIASNRALGRGPAGRPLRQRRVPGAPHRRAGPARRRCLRVRASAPRPLPSSVDEVVALLRERDYVADRSLATALFLSLRLGRPLFLEGDAGVGKTELAKVLAGALGRRLLRLQCYEGLDLASAAYEWNYPRQMLEIRIAEASHEVDRARIEQDLFAPRFLVKRPLLQALEPDPAGARPAHRRDRPHRRAVRGLPAGGALGLPAHHPRAGDRARGGAAPGGGHLQPDPGDRTTRSSAAASTPGSTTRTPRASSPSCASRSRRPPTG